MSKGVNNTKILSIAICSLLVVSFSGQNVLGYGGPPAQSSSGNYTIEIYSDKESYSLGDSLIVSGNVNKYSEDRSLQITIFDSQRSLILNEKFTVNSDTSFSHEIVLGDDFEEGEYTARVQYGTSKVTVEKFSFTVTSGGTMQESNTTKIPDWIKSNAGWWADGQIDDSSFVQGIQFLIKDGLMVIPATEQGASSDTNEIPDWIKQNARWWADGQIDDSSFVLGIQFLIKDGLMKISQ